MEQTITVSQLAWYIKKIFEAEELLYNISVVGEVSGIKIVRGIAYFDLKDASSLISCVAFDGEALTNIKNGDKVVAKGTPGFYVKGGKLNFNVSSVAIAGQGELFQKFLELKEKLSKLGFFDESHKKPVPAMAKRVGVITSETGAVLHDIINVATRRNPGVDIVLFPAKVQGEGSAQSIICGLEYFENYSNVDVVIIARGGGSAEDLWEFNDEALARKIFEVTVPVVSAVGHETDFTICDFVADVRAPTPSAGAELVVENVLEKKLAFSRQIMLVKSRLESIVFDQETHLNERAQTALFALDNKLQKIDFALNLKKVQLEKFDPNKILALGYAKLELGGKVITSAKALKTGDRIDIHLKDGKKKGEIL